MREIPLTQGKVALIDDADYELVSQYKWFADISRNTWYARTNVKRPNGSWTSLKMHRLIIGAQKGEQVDHRDRNGLNNTRANLRISTVSQNCQNKRTPQHNKSGYKGVYYESAHTHRPWRAYIKIGNKQHKIGSFATREEAAQAYNEMALKHFGEFAHLNKIP